MIASLKSYSRIARTLLGILGALLIVGIIGSMLMGVRAKNNARLLVIDQAQAIADGSLSLLFAPTDLQQPVSPTRATELSAQIDSIVLEPTDFASVTVFSPEGRVLYSTEEVRIGNEMTGERDRIKEALKDTPQVSNFESTISVMIPLRFRSGVGAPAAVQLSRPDTPISTAADPWNTNAMFLFAMLLVLGFAVFGVARLLTAVANERPSEIGDQKPLVHYREPRRAAAPQPGLREEGEARRRAEERAQAAEERLTLLQDQYRKSLEELQDYRESSTVAQTADVDPQLEERALRAEGQVRTLERQIETLRSERARLSEQLQDALRAPVGSDEVRAAAAEREAAELRVELERARAALEEAAQHAERVAGAADDDVRTELDATHVELLRTKDDLTATESQLLRVRRELDDARTELRALRAEERRAAMLEDELRAAKAELASKDASHRADLVEREAEFEEKVRETRERLQQQLADLETQYASQLQQVQDELAGRITDAEAAARAAAAELETTRADLDAAQMDVEASRGEAAAREQRVLEAHDEILHLRNQIQTLESEIKERTLAVTQAHKEAEDFRRSLVGAQADLTNADEAIESARSEVDALRQRAEVAEQMALSVANERDTARAQVDKLIRQLDDAAADNQELNRRLQDFEARRQLELADDQGRAQIDELLRVTQERLAGQTEKLITAEERVRELEAEVAEATERADLAEAEMRTHQMSEALREMREHDGAGGRDPAAQREAVAATSEAITAGALEDRRATTPFLKELSMDAKKSIARIDGITKLLRHKKDAKEQTQLMKQLATFTRRLDLAVADIADAERLVNGTIELNVKRTDMQALVARVVEESGAGADHDIRVVSDSLKLKIDPVRTEQILTGLLRASTERTQNGKAIVVRLKHVDGGAVLSVEDPAAPNQAAPSPVVQRIVELQGGTITVEEIEAGGTAFRVFLPDGGGHARPADAPALQITVDENELEPEPAETGSEPEDEWEAEAAHKTLAAELRRLAELQSGSKK
jgi:hypothetical protein